MPWRASISGISRSVQAATAASEIGTPSTWMRSRNETRCGEVYSPTRKPRARSAAATRVDTLPFPLVPPMWMVGKTVCGSPTAASRARVVSSPNLMDVVRGKRKSSACW